MSAQNVDKWTPVSRDDIALKKALLTLQESTDSVLLSHSDQKEENKEEKKLLLQGKNYFGRLAPPSCFPTTDLIIVVR